MEEKDRKPSAYFKPAYFVYILLIAVGIYLVAYHGPHLWTILPFLIFLACPLMHLMHHRKHKESDKNQEHKDDNKHKGCH